MRVTSRSGLAPVIRIPLHPLSPLRFRVPPDPQQANQPAEMILRKLENARDYHWLHEANGFKCATRQIRQLRRFEAGLGTHYPDRWPSRRWGRGRKGISAEAFPLGIP